MIYIDPHNREEQNMISRTHNDQGAEAKNITEEKTSKNTEEQLSIFMFE